MLFCIAIDFILHHMEVKHGTDVGTATFNDWACADDTALSVQSADATTTVQHLSSSLLPLSDCRCHGERPGAISQRQHATP